MLRDNETQKLQVDKLGKELFQKEQKMKVMADRVKHLENSNNYRKEVTRLEGVVEQREAEIQMIKEELRRSKESNAKIVEEKLKLVRELKASEETKLQKIKALEEAEGKLQRTEVDNEEKLSKIKDMEKNQEEAMKIEKALEENNNKIVTNLEEELKKSQEKVAVLEQNKTFILNENTILKNEAKVLKNKEKHQEQEKKLPEGKGDQDQDSMKKELNNLQRELRRFKEFTFKKLDEITGRGSSSSSTQSCTSGDDQESGAESEEITKNKNHDSGAEPENVESHIQKKKSSLKRKQWENTAEVKSPWVLRYEANNLQTAEASPDENGRTIPVVPGTVLYSESVRGSTMSPQNSDSNEEERARKINAIKARRQRRENKTLVFSSSITRDITRTQRSFNESYKKGDVTIHEFKGKKARDIVRYMQPHLEDEQPSSVVFVAGGNDLPNRDISEEEIRKVADFLVEGGRLCKTQYGVENIFISSIMPRENSDFQGNRHRLNKILRDMCSRNGFIFIDNNNIVLRPHGHLDGIHLNREGSDILRDNLLNALNR